MSLPAYHYTEITWPEPTYQIWFTPHLVYSCPGKIPHPIHRWFLKLIFGIKIVPIKNEPKNAKP